MALPSLMTTETVLLGVNRVAGCAAHSRGIGSTATRGLVAFGSHHAVAVLDPVRCCIVATLAGHEARVNGVAWISNVAESRYLEEVELVSCSSDGTLRAWRRAAPPDGGVDAAVLQHWTCSAILRGHGATVTSVACVTLRDGAVVAASTSSDCTLRAWVRRDGDEWLAVAPATVRPSGVFEAVAVSLLPARRSEPGSAPGVVVAAGGVDGKVHLFHVAESTLDDRGADAAPPFSLTPLLALAGHTDWIRSLAFSLDTELEAHFGSGGGSISRAVPPSSARLVLASAAQDNKVRLWRVDAVAGAPSCGDARDGAAAAAAGARPRDGKGASDSDEEADDDEEGATADSAGAAAGDWPPIESLSSLLLAAAAGGGAVGQRPTGAAQPDDARDAGGLALQRPRGFAVAAATAGGSAARFEVALDALLTGHDAWVSSVRWHPPVALSAPPGALSSNTNPDSPGAARLWQPPCLVTSSMDKTAALWQPQRDGTAAGGLRVTRDATLTVPADGVDAAATWAAAAASAWEGAWAPVARVGGGNALGLLSAGVSPDGGVLTATGFHGALHVWAREHCPSDGGGVPLLALPRDFDARATCCSARRGRARWLPAAAPSGHFGAVSHVAWGSRGRYLVSWSADCTVRVWGPVAYTAVSAAAAAAASWHEVSRPQIHGYEMVSGGVPPAPGCAPHTLVSAGDEKVLRVFAAPLQFLRALRSVCGATLGATGYGARPGDDDESLGAAAPRAEFAYVPELGLTNKGVLADASAAAAAVPDRMQVDGKDAVQTAYTAAAAVSRGAATAALSTARAAGKGARDGAAGRGDADAGGAVSSAGDEDDEGGDGGQARTLGGATRRVAGEEPSLPATATTGANDTATAALERGPDGSSARAPVSSAWGDPASLGLPPPLSGMTPPPLEGDLVQHTRWPETGKLFGHAAEVVAVALNGSGTLIASACKARDEGGAAIALWDARTMRQLQLLRGHKLSVVALAFSPARGALACAALPGDATGGKSATGYAWLRDVAAAGDLESDALVSVSKDRTLIVWGCSSSLGGEGSGAPPTYKLLASVVAHKRVVWDVSWAPLPVPRVAAAEIGDAADDADAVAVFATGARDQTVKVWGLRRPAVVDAAGPRHGGLALEQLTALPPFADSVTAVAFAPVARRAHGRGSVTTAWLAVGLERGGIGLWAIESSSGGPGGGRGWTAHAVAHIDAHLGGHDGAVRSLAWRPLPAWDAPEAAACLTNLWSHAAAGAPRLLLASGGEDASVRLMRVALPLAAP